MNGMGYSVVLITTGEILGISMMKKLCFFHIVYSPEKLTEPENHGSSGVLCGVPC